MKRNQNRRHSQGDAKGKSFAGLLVWCVMVGLMTAMTVSALSRSGDIEKVSNTLSSRPAAIEAAIQAAEVGH